MDSYTEGDVLYENALSSLGDIAGWVMEGDGVVSFPRGKMRQESVRPREAGQAGNIVHWCPITFQTIASDAFYGEWKCDPAPLRARRIYRPAER